MALLLCLRLDLIYLWRGGAFETVHTSTLQTREDSEPKTQKLTFVWPRDVASTCVGLRDVPHTC